jgi:broad specificity phosphatase PhoE
MASGGEGTRPGAIILARHGKPDLSRMALLSADDYRRWWSSYEEVGLRPGQGVPEALKAAAISAGGVYASTRPRSVESAKIVVGADGAFVSDPLLIEAPLPPPLWPTWIKLPPMAWGFIARSWWWFFNQHAEEESRAQAEARADQVAQRLIADAGGGHDVLVLAHGFFNAMIGRALRRRGWRCTRDEGYRYWSARRFEAR